MSKDNASNLYAAALQIDEYDNLYRLLVSAEGHLAEYLMTLASSEGVPVHKNPKLIEELRETADGAKLSPQAQRAVQVVFSFLLDCERDASKARAERA